MYFIFVESCNTTRISHCDSNKFSKYKKYVLYKITHFSFLIMQTRSCTSLHVCDFRELGKSWICGQSHAHAAPFFSHLAVKVPVKAGNLWKRWPGNRFPPISFDLNMSKSCRWFWLFLTPAPAKHCIYCMVVCWPHRKPQSLYSL